MKIIGLSQSLEKYADMAGGDCFEYCGEFYMVARTEEKRYYAVNLENGLLVDFNKEQIVKPIEVEAKYKYS